KARSLIQGLSKLVARGDETVGVADIPQHPLPVRWILTAQHCVADLAQIRTIIVGPGDASGKAEIARPVDGAPLVAVSTAGNMRFQVTQALFTDLLSEVEEE